MVSSCWLLVRDRDETGMGWDVNPMARVCDLRDTETHSSREPSSPQTYSLILYSRVDKKIDMPNPAGLGLLGGRSSGVESLYTLAKVYIGEMRTPNENSDSRLVRYNGQGRRTYSVPLVLLRWPPDLA